ncbi:hypothetical protein [Maribellus sediminis]|uniref:hypothetical protein n=1 Tax=Maribellus sediminis TaxID=2696285 RepID=UPI001431179A|nr:hypothetical protein [Maribellus sediminis]
MTSKFLFFSIAIVSVFLFYSNSGFAQDYSFTQNYINELDDYINYANIDRNSSQPATYDNIEGSPFVYKDFVEGELKLNTGKTYKGPLRYDIYADEIEFVTSDKVIYTVKNPEAIQLAILGETKFNYFPPGEFKGVKGYYEVLVIGDYSLYEKYQIALKDPQAARPYVEAKPAKFLRQDSKFFIMDPDANFTEIGNKKDLLSNDLDKDKLEAFVKKNKIKISDREDLKRFVQFLNDSN